jgi:TRAP-type uncharacterized transport system substrate-binding protein
MRRVTRAIGGAATLLLTLAPFAGAPKAQDSQSPESRAQQRASQQARETYRERVNENVLFLMGGQLGAAYIQIAHDVAVVVDDGMNLRVLPVVGGAGVQNVHDVVFLRGIDLALTNIQTLNAMKRSNELGPNLDRQIAYIAPLFPEEAQIVARKQITSIEALRGKKVGVNNRGSATAQFAPPLFKTLGIDIEPVFLSQPDALQRMRNGELEATICICPKPVPAFVAVRPEWEFKLLEIPFTPALQSEYFPAQITSEEYPTLLPPQERVETIAGSTVLITFNWPRGSSRYARTAKFVDAFFSKFSELQKSPRHPLWKSVNYAANLPGWQRFAAAQEWLDRSKAAQDSAIEASFGEFVKLKTAQGAQVDLTDPEEKERLFREFLEWSQKSKKQ